MIDIDHSIIKACKSKDRKAQMQVYDAFAKRIYNTCCRIVGRLEAEDTMQESFVKAFVYLDSYVDDVPFESWLVRIAINTSIDKMRQKKEDAYTFNDHLGVEYEYTESDGDEDWDVIYGKVDEVKKAIETLTDNDRIILNLYLMEGYDHEEIAGILQINEGSVRVRYMRAKHRLSTILNKN